MDDLEEGIINKPKKAPFHNRLVNKEIVKSLDPTLRTSLPENFNDTIRIRIVKSPNKKSKEKKLQKKINIRKGLNINNNFTGKKIISIQRHQNQSNIISLYLESTEVKLKSGNIANSVVNNNDNETLFKTQALFFKTKLPQFIRTNKVDSCPDSDFNECNVDTKNVVDHILSIPFSLRILRINTSRRLPSRLLYSIELK